MITVDLSDPPVAPTLDTLNHQLNSLAVLEDPEAQDEGLAVQVDNAVSTKEDATMPEEGTEYMPRESTASMASFVEEEPSMSTSSTVRSRSDSSGTFSSAGSAQVDWDELERSEEQAPRDEGSDEVRYDRSHNHHSISILC